MVVRNSESLQALKAGSLLWPKQTGCKAIAEVTSLEGPRVTGRSKRRGKANGYIKLDSVVISQISLSGSCPSAEFAKLPLTSDH